MIASKIFQVLQSLCFIGSSNTVRGGPLLVGKTLLFWMLQLICLAPYNFFPTPLVLALVVDPE
jgi:hypothetical protein